MYATGPSFHNVMFTKAHIPADCGLTHLLNAAKTILGWLKIYVYVCIHRHRCEHKHI